MRFSRGIFIFALILFPAVGTFLWSILSPASRGDETVNISIASGETEVQIAQKLKDLKLIRSKTAFDIYVWIRQIDRKFKIGTHQISRGSTIVKVVRDLTVMTRDEVAVRLQEGWTKEQIAAELETKGIVSRQDFIAAALATDSRFVLPNKTFSFLKDKPATASLEGYLFPDTYRFFRNSTAADVLAKLLENFDRKYDDDLRRTIVASNHRLFDVVIMASVVEEEVRTVEDRPIVAGIFWKRLAAGIPLQADSTVNFATGNSRPQPTAEDLKVDSLYNTYQHRGLPPGPIDNPSFAAIRAAAAPKDSPYLYFLTKPDGTVVYAQTLEEHNSNKAKYLR